MNKENTPLLTNGDLGGRVLFRSEFVKVYRNGFHPEDKNLDVNGSSFEIRSMKDGDDTEPNEPYCLPLQLTVWEKLTGNKTVHAILPVGAVYGIHEINPTTICLVLHNKACYNPAGNKTRIYKFKFNRNDFIHAHHVISVACSHRTRSHEDDLMEVDTPIKSAIVKRKNEDGYDSDSMSCQSPPLFGIKPVVPN
jgi:hypothetical protein